MAKNKSIIRKAIIEKIDINELLEVVEKLKGLEYIRAVTTLMSYAIPKPTEKTEIKVDEDSLLAIYN